MVFLLENSNFFKSGCVEINLLEMCLIKIPAKLNIVHTIINIRTKFFDNMVRFQLVQGIVFIKRIIGVIIDLLIACEPKFRYIKSEKKTALQTS